MPEVKARNYGILKQLKQVDNRLCADCNHPLGDGEHCYASLSYSVWLCDLCAEAHILSLGTNGSIVKRAFAEKWSVEQVIAMASTTNVKANSIFERYVPEGWKKISRGSSSFERRTWIRAKYYSRYFMVPQNDAEKRKQEERSGGGTGDRSRESRIVALNTLPTRILDYFVVLGPGKRIRRSSEDAFRRSGSGSGSGRSANNNDMDSTSMQSFDGSKDIHSNNNGELSVSRVSDKTPSQGERPAASDTTTTTAAAPAIMPSRSGKGGGVGVRGSDSGFRSSTIELENLLHGMAFNPKVTDCYPPENTYKDATIPELLGPIIFPGGMQLMDEYQAPFLFTFVLTDTSRVKMYGTALIYYELLDPDQLKALMKQNNSVPSGGICCAGGESGNSNTGGHYTHSTKSMRRDNNTTNSRPSSSPSSSAIPGTPGATPDSDATFTPVIYAPKALAVLSHYGFFSLHSRFLTQLYHTSLSAPPLPLERYIHNFMLELPLPPQGVTEVYFSLPAARSLLQLSRPAQNQLPMVDFSYRPLFACLSVDNILKIFACLVSEMAICVCSENMALLTPVQEALLSLLFPFVWQGVYIPILPSNMQEILHAPVPLLAGLHDSYLTNTPPKDRPKSVVIVHLDADSVEITPGDDFFPTLEIPALPRKKLEKLRKRLVEFGGCIYRSPGEVQLMNMAGFPFPNNEHLTPIRAFTAEQGSIVAANDFLSGDSNSGMSAQELEYKMQKKGIRKLSGASGLIGTRVSNVGVSSGSSPPSVSSPASRSVGVSGEEMYGGEREGGGFSGSSNHFVSIAGAGGGIGAAVGASGAGEERDSFRSEGRDDFHSDPGLSTLVTKIKPVPYRHPAAATLVSSTGGYFFKESILDPANNIINNTHGSSGSSNSGSSGTNSSLHSTNHASSIHGGNSTIGLGRASEMRVSTVSGTTSVNGRSSPHHHQHNHFRTLNAEFNAKEIRDAFLRFFVAVLIDYEDFVSDSASQQQQQQQKKGANGLEAGGGGGGGRMALPVLAAASGGKVFDTEAFLAHEQYDPFVRRLLESQMFTNFMDEKLASANQSQIRFFDESILAKENRSKFSLSKNVTPFLADERDYISGSYITPGPSTHGVEHGVVFKYPQFPTQLDPKKVGPARAAQKLVLIKQKELKRLHEPSTMNATGHYLSATEAFRRRSLAATLAASTGMGMLGMMSNMEENVSSRSNISSTSAISSSSAISSGSNASMSTNMIQYGKKGGGKAQNLHIKAAEGAVDVDNLMEVLEEARSYFLQIVKGLTAAQALYRARPVRRRYLAYKMAAVRIQRLYHRLSLKLIVKRRIHARYATKIQALLRQRNVRKQFLRARWLIRTLQSIARAIPVRRFFVRYRSAVICSQAHWRGYRERARQRETISILFDGYRQQCLYLWAMERTSLLYRSSFWTLIDRRCFLSLSLYRDELLRLYESLGFYETSSSHPFLSRFHSTLPSSPPPLPSSPSPFAASFYSWRTFHEQFAVIEASSLLAAVRVVAAAGGAHVTGAGAATSAGAGGRGTVPVSSAIPLIYGDRVAVVRGAGGRGGERRGVGAAGDPLRRGVSRNTVVERPSSLHIRTSHLENGTNITNTGAVSGGRGSFGQKEGEWLLYRDPALTAKQELEERKEMYRILKSDTQNTIDREQFFTRFGMTVRKKRKHDLVENRIWTQCSVVHADCSAQTVVAIYDGVISPHIEWVKELIASKIVVNCACVVAACMAALSK